MNWFKKTIIADRTFTGIEFLKALKPFNIVINRNQSGSGVMLINLNNGKQDSLHQHKGKNIPEGTIKAILRELGIDVKSFYDYLTLGKKEKKEFNLPKKPELIEQPKITPDWQKSDWYQNQQQLQGVGA